MFLGTPGSGKTTQAKLLAGKLGIPFFTTGDLFRDLAQEDSPRGRYAREILEKGQLASDEVTLQVVEERLASAGYQDGVIIDGFPRTLNQAQSFSVPLAKVFYIKISDPTSTERLLGRGRSDDTPKVIQERLAVYHKETEPIIAFYKKLGILEEVNGERGVEEIAQDILGRLNG